MIDIIVAVVCVAIIGVSIYAAFFHKGSSSGGTGGGPGVGDGNGDNGDNDGKPRKDGEGHI